MSLYTKIFYRAGARTSAKTGKRIDTAATVLPLLALVSTAVGGGIVFAAFKLRTDPDLRRRSMFPIKKDEEVTFIRDMFSVIHSEAKSKSLDEEDPYKFLPFVV